MRLLAELRGMNQNSTSKVLSARRKQTMKDYEKIAPAGALPQSEYKIVGDPTDVPRVENQQNDIGHTKNQY
ncbi:Protein of unknown function [Pyronema omphalodes CBS 100304]|uniref:Uncharacterized protein n=1 Tax=Pyronema omphalodes (strain CBS 100304) TaxID=1076935 RepID=U4LR11_PYROM|nr:Protein of unknown function [Pyronema omphalodes CBS 100304]